MNLFSRFVRRYRSSVNVLVLCSLLLNLLTFAGSLYMMMVYDSVLPSGSIPTLFGLFAMILLVYIFQALFEWIRSETMLGIATGVREDLSAPVRFATVNHRLRSGTNDGDGLQLVRDLDQLHAFLASTGPAALLDLPWMVLFLIVLTVLHWSLGLVALLGALVLMGIAVLSARRTQHGTRELTTLTGRRMGAALSELRFAEAAMAMGMQHRLSEASRQHERTLVTVQEGLSRTLARFGGAGRTFRLFLQSAILTVGALLVIDGKASGGVVFASSILAGRALAPIDQVIANWRGFAAARSGWTRIVDAVTRYRPQTTRAVTLGPPNGPIQIRDAWLVPPGSTTTVLSGVSIDMHPGQALAVIGQSASGKSSLARALLGLWPVARGEVRIDGATHDQWDPEVLGASFGYVPQEIDLIGGTVGQNIARFNPAAPSDAVIAAARAAGMHETILALPRGYETMLRPGGPELSAGQRQRVGLARALYGDPFLLVLDEANSNLDADGDIALAQAIEAVKARGGIVVMITHRPATLGPITHIAALAGGRLVDFGTRDDVLGRLNAKGPRAVDLQQQRTGKS
jgi:ATP-binding cassette, subfamily C, bacterial PrsD